MVDQNKNNDSFRSLKSSPSAKILNDKTKKKPSILDKIIMPAVIVEQEGLEESRKTSLVVRPEDVASFVAGHHKHHPHVHDHKPDLMTIDEPEDSISPKAQELFERTNQMITETMREAFEKLRYLKDVQVSARAPKVSPLVAKLYQESAAVVGLRRY